MFLYTIFYAYDHILYLMKSWLDTFNSTNMIHYTLNILLSLDVDYVSACKKPLMYFYNVEIIDRVYKYHSFTFYWMNKTDF